MTSVKPFQIRGRFFTAVTLRLSGDADRAFYDALDAQLQQTPQFFRNAPFVVDLEHAPGLAQPGAIATLAKELRGRKLALIGIQNGSEAQTAAAAEAGLIPLPGGREVPVEQAARTSSRVEARARREALQKPAQPEAAAEPAAGPAPEAAPSSLVITKPVRSGQTVFADRGDLVVIGSVSSGAELVAAGNIHVYGTLRGRALAGVNGDQSARIFCQNLDAELLAVAGLYRTSEDLDPGMGKQCVQAFLKDEKLCVEAL